MKKIVLLLIAVSFLAGCASIVSGTKQKVRVNADPGKAVVTIVSQSGIEYYKGAPAEVQLPRKETYTVEIAMDGYLTQKIVVSHALNGWFIGNLCFGGIPGGVVDFITGAMWKLEPDTINIVLKTALLDSENGPMIVFFAFDQDGELRSLSVPMIKA